MSNNLSDQRVSKGKITRDNILESALDIICNQGIEGLSASKIAAQAKISKSTVFHHFKAVDEIPFTILENIGDSLTNDLLAKDLESFKSYLYNLGEITFSTDSKDIMFFKAFLSFYQNAIFNTKYRKAMEGCSMLFKNTLIILIDRFYSIDSRKSESIATLIYATIDGLGMHFLANPNRGIFLESWYNFSDMIVLSLEKYNKHTE